MMKNVVSLTLCLLLGMFTYGASNAPCIAADNPFVGDWALTIPGGGAGWLGIEQQDGKLTGSILWGGGSVVPVTSARVDGDTLVVTRVYEVRRSGATEPSRETETITATRDGDNLKLTTQREGADGKVRGKASFTGKRIPPPPAAPDLSQVKFGKPIELFNGKDLTGWVIMNPNAAEWLECS